MEVTALIPTFNGEAFVARTLDSLRSQTYPHLRILVSDDNSTDRTLGICAAAAQQDSRVDVVAQPSRLGWIGNYQWLERAATSPLVFHAPHDDMFSPTYVARCVEALASRPEAVLAYSATRWHKLDGSVVEITTPVASEPQRVARATPFLQQRDPARWFAFRGVIRADVLAKAGGLRKGLHPAADGRMLFRLALAGPFAFVADLLVDKYQHADSTAMTFNRSVTGALASYLPEVVAARATPAEKAAMLHILGKELRRRRMLARRARSA